jgi:rhodanese-related sulfurtransferase
MKSLFGSKSLSSWMRDDDASEQQQQRSRASKTNNNNNNNKRSSGTTRVENERPVENRKHVHSRQQNNRRRRKSGGKSSKSRSSSSSSSLSLSNQVVVDDVKMEESIFGATSPTSSRQVLGSPLFFDSPSDLSNSLNDGYSDDSLLSPPLRTRGARDPARSVFMSSFTAAADDDDDDDDDDNADNKSDKGRFERVVEPSRSRRPLYCDAQGNKLPKRATRVSSRVSLRRAIDGVNTMLEDDDGGGDDASNGVNKRGVGVGGGVAQRKKKRRDNSTSSSEDNKLRHNVFSMSTPGLGLDLDSATEAFQHFDSAPRQQVQTARPWAVPSSADDLFVGSQPEPTIRFGSVDDDYDEGGFVRRRSSSSDARSTVCAVVVVDDDGAGDSDEDERHLVAAFRRTVSGSEYQPVLRNRPVTREDDALSALSARVGRGRGSGIGGRLQRSATAVGISSLRSFVAIGDDDSDNDDGDQHGDWPTLNAVSPSKSLRALHIGDASPNPMGLSRSSSARTSDAGGSFSLSVSDDYGVAPNSLAASPGALAAAAASSSSSRRGGAEVARRQALRQRSPMSHDVPQVARPRFGSYIESRPPSLLSQSSGNIDFSMPSQRTLARVNRPGCSLPTIRGSHPDMNCISASTAATIIFDAESPLAARFNRVVVVDCRYPFEFDGGHIRTAINAPHDGVVRDLFFKTPPTSHQESKRTCIIFHCEFSSKRGPRAYRYLRRTDRQANIDTYPQLFYPEIYLLEGGYRAFFAAYGSHCLPQAYIEMKDPRYNQELRNSKRLHHRRNSVVSADVRQRRDSSNRTGRPSSSYSLRRSATDFSAHSSSSSRSSRSMRSRTLSNAAFRASFDAAAAATNDDAREEDESATAEERDPSRRQPRAMDPRQAERFRALRSRSFAF